jgi:hypothetical protein
MVGRYLCLKQEFPAIAAAEKESLLFFAPIVGQALPDNMEHNYVRQSLTY